ncbi:hypothetical protein LguiB_026776 [Lonicera macranthoides]
MALPKYFVLKSNYNKKYLEFVKEDGEVHGLNKFYGENPAVSPYAKYEIVTAKTGGGLVHIKCCYNNKYLVRWSPNHYWIASTAAKPEEDKCKWSCTLFEFLPIDGKTIRFRHIQLGHYACLWRLGSQNVYDSCLFAGSKGVDKDQCDVFTIIDWESQYTLPRDVGFKYFVLKSNYNKKYLEYVKEDVEVHGLNKISRENPVSPYGKYEIEKANTGDRLVHIKCCYNNKYFVRWSPSHYWIAAAADKPEEDESKWSCTLFEILPIDAKTIRFRHIQLGHYACLWRLGSENVYDSCLFAGVPEFDKDQCDVFTIIDWESLCKELATSRHIYNVNYHLKNATIYDQSLLLLASGTVVNRTKQPNTFVVKLAYIDSKSKAWNASVLNKGVTTHIVASFPVINADGKVEILDGSTGVFKWGEAIESSKISKVVYKVTVPAMTQVKVSLLATKDSCDVPFSYSQVDTLTNGTIVGQTMNDGIYTGFNYYDFNYETEEEQLAACDLN